LSGVVLICAHCLLAQDWPQWRGANRDGPLARDSYHGVIYLHFEAPVSGQAK
jgi:hypothetical protein